MFMETLSQAINRFQELGYNENLSVEQISKLLPSEWIIDDIARFEGRSNPSDNSILYAISNITNKRKILIVNAYGLYGDSQVNDFVRNVMKTKT